jgi:hypothetical protein
MLNLIMLGLIFVGMLIGDRRTYHSPKIIAHGDTLATNTTTM